MIDSDKTEFSKLMMGMSEMYGREFSPIVAKLYFETLRPFDYQAVNKALMAHINNPDGGQFFPKPADIVKMISGTNSDRSMQAWSKVDRAVRTIGPYQSVVFDDAIIHRVIQDMGGWVMLGNKQDEDWPFVAREFATRYQGYTMRGEVPEHPKMLYGIAQMHNDPNNYEVEPPKLIGDKDAAKRLLLGNDNTKRIGTT